jgi:hypothetical protein
VRSLVMAECTRGQSGSDYMTGQIIMIDGGMVLV